ncbi:hypothetical protein EC968_006653 [Mortierella alpina]|nr:hypothetical protein EC968_006653 [Mortierella alpina]
MALSIKLPVGWTAMTVRLVNTIKPRTLCRWKGHDVQLLSEDPAQDVHDFKLGDKIEVRGHLIVEAQINQKDEIEFELLLVVQQSRCQTVQEAIANEDTGLTDRDRGLTDRDRRDNCQRDESPKNKDLVGNKACSSSKSASKSFAEDSDNPRTSRSIASSFATRSFEDSCSDYSSSDYSNSDSTSSHNSGPDNSNSDDSSSDDSSSDDSSSDDSSSDDSNSDDSNSDDSNSDDSSSDEYNSDDTCSDYSSPDNPQPENDILNQGKTTARKRSPEAEVEAEAENSRITFCSKRSKPTSHISDLARQAVPASYLPPVISAIPQPSGNQYFQVLHTSGGSYNEVRQGHIVFDGRGRRMSNEGKRYARKKNTGDELFVLEQRFKDGRVREIAIVTDIQDHETPNSLLLRDTWRSW